MTLAQVNAALDPWIAVRVAAHLARREGAITVPVYLAALQAVRFVEDMLEWRRRALGAESNRAFELVTTPEQLTLEIAA